MASPIPVRWTLDLLRARCIEDGDCLIWPLAATRGQPRVSMGGRTIYLRRWVLEQRLRRPLRRDESVTTTCMTPMCCAAGHLRATTRAEITARSYRDGSRCPARDYRMGVACAMRNSAKLDAAKAAAIRADERGARAVAAEYGVSPQTVYAIRSGRRWRGLAANSSVFAWRGAA